MMSRANFRDEEGALSTQRELSMKEDSMVRFRRAGAYGPAGAPKPHGYFDQEKR
jgi:hypothetical protein